MTTSTESKVWPDVAIPPGELLAEELEVRGMPQSEMAARLEVSSRRFRDIVSGRRAITADLALGLEAILGIDAQFWMNLQTDYDLTVARLQRRTA